MKRFAPATDRNRAPILEVLRDVLPPEGELLEIASGTGQHAVFLAPHFPGWRWYPTDVDPEALESIAAWLEEVGASNIAPPQPLDVTRGDWPITRADAVLCCNMIHIAPWSACLGLFAGAARVLTPGGVLCLYGPFVREDAATAASNVAFDLSLRRRNPAWGLRDLGAVTDVARAAGFTRERVVTMPANNLTIVFRA